MSVDELWEQLKRGAGPAAGRSRVSLSGLAGMPGITSHVKVYDKSRSQQAQQPRPSFIAQLGRQQAQAQGAQHQAQGSGSSEEHNQALMASLQRDINGLSDPDRTTRLRAVEKLHTALLGASTRGAPEALQAALAGPLLVPLVRLLADPTEKCRELATALLAAALQRLPLPATLLPTLVPALAERVGTPPVQENSEEMRLALAELVAGPLLAHSSSSLLADLLAPLAAIVWCQLQDPYADIKKAACTSAASLAGAAAPNALPQALQQPLVLALAANLAHQHSRVRLASLQAMHALVLHGMPLALVQEHVLPAVRPLSHDHAPAIRAALFSSVAKWVGGQLPADDAADDGRAANQCRALLPLLLPLLLLGMTDEVEATRSYTYAQMEAIGARMASQAASSGELPSSTALDQSVELPGYCHPFSAGRPSLEARWIVQSQLTRLLQQSLTELREWTATQRVSAARLLRVALIYGEAAVLPQLPTVMHVLRGAVADDDAGVAVHIVGCVHVLGVNLAARQWMPLAAEGVAAEEQSAAQRTAALVVLSALLHAASKAGSYVDTQSLQLAAVALGKALRGAEAGHAAVEAAVQQQLLAACSNMVQWAGPSIAEVAPQLFQVLLQLWALQLDGQSAAAGADPAIHAPSSAGSLTASVTLDQLAVALGRTSPAELCEPFGLALLQGGIQNHGQWTHAHPDWRILSALVRLCNSCTLVRLWPRVLPALALIAAGHDRDPHLRLELFQLLAALLEDDGKADAWQQAAVGQQLVCQVLVPGLVWRAGRLPAAMRYTALTALALLLTRQRLPPEQLAQLASEGGDAAVPGEGLLVRVVGCMDEDYEPDTRQLACHVAELLLSSVGPQLPAQQLMALQAELLKRLDDSSNRVRVAACAALQPWLHSLLAVPSALTDANAAGVASGMLIHLDDTDAAVAEAVCTVLEQLAAARPGAVKPLAQAVAGQHLQCAFMDRVLAASGT